LATLPSAVGCAQRFVRFTLERWRLPDLMDMLVASRLSIPRSHNFTVTVADGAASQLGTSPAQRRSWT
jgi:hypothetical protein